MWLNRAVAGAKRRAWDDEQGIGVVIAMSIATIVGMLGAVWFTIANHELASSSRSRSRDQAMQIAEAGLTRAMSDLTDNPALASIGLQSVVDTNGKTFGEYEVAISSGATALQRVVEVTGYSPYKSHVTARSRKIRATVEFDRPETFGSALFAYSADATQPGNVVAGGALTVTGDVYASGYAKWGHGSTLSSDISSWGGVDSRGSVTGRIATVGALGGVCGSGIACGVWVRSGTVTGDVFAVDDAAGNGGRAEIYNNNNAGDPQPKVVGSVYTQDAGPAPAPISISTSQSPAISGTQWTGVRGRVPALQQMPTFTYNAANYTPAPLNRNATTFDDDFDNAFLGLGGMSGTYNVQDGAGTIQLGDTATQTTCLPLPPPPPSPQCVSQELPVTSWNLSGNLTIHTNLPVVIDKTFGNNSSPATDVRLTIISTFSDGAGGTPAIRMNGSLSPPSSVTVLAVAPNDSITADGSAKVLRGAIYGKAIDLNSGGTANFSISHVAMDTCVAAAPGCDAPGFTWPVARFLDLRQIDVREVNS